MMRYIKENNREELCDFDFVRFIHRDKYFFNVLYITFSQKSIISKL